MEGIIQFINSCRYSPNLWLFLYLLFKFPVCWNLAIECFYSGSLSTQQHFKTIRVCVHFRYKYRWNTGSVGLFSASFMRLKHGADGRFLVACRKHFIAKRQALFVAEYPTCLILGNSSQATEITVTHEQFIAISTAAISSCSRVARKNRPSAPCFSSLSASKCDDPVQQAMINF